MEPSNVILLSRVSRVANSFNWELIKDFWNRAHVSESKLRISEECQGTMTLVHTVPLKSIGETIQEILRGVVSSDRRREPTTLGIQGTHSRS
jgi:hypothetical protein